MPSAPSKIGARSVAFSPPSGREHESYDTIDSGTAILPAGAGFITIAQFGARTDAIRVYTNSAFTQLRVSNRGEAARTLAIVAGTSPIELPIRCELVEASDPTGVGAGRVTAVGLYASRHIDRRENKGGPFLKHVHAHRDEAPEQVEAR